TLPGGDFKESSHLDPRLIEVVRIFEKERPGVPMRVDHAELMLGDADRGYNAGYSFHGRMLALGQIDGVMAACRN
ncbi:mannonate dehydratase, partial [uncultured Duncaniella sp.]